MKLNVPKFISVEGIDGCGKTTMTKFLAECIRNKNYEVVVTKDPGATSLGNKLRQIVLNELMSPMTELKLFDAIRQDMIDNVVIPNILNGKIVVSDRYIDSMVAYQGYGRGLHKEVEKIIKDTLKPDKTILLNISLEESIRRLKNRNSFSNAKENRFDSEKMEFKKRVYEGYIEQARLYSNRIDVIDASGSIEEVKSKIKNWVNKYF